MAGAASMSRRGRPRLPPDRIPNVTLRSVNGSHQLRRLETLVGRDEEAVDLCVRTRTLDPSHARIIYNADTGLFRVEDLGSANGTFVNDVRLHGPRDLRDRDLIRFGFDPCTHLVEYRPDSDALLRVDGGGGDGDKSSRRSRTRRKKRTGSMYRGDSGDAAGGRQVRQEQRRQHKTRRSRETRISPEGEPEYASEQTAAGAAGAEEKAEETESFGEEPEELHARPKSVAWADRGRQSRTITVKQVFRPGHGGPGDSMVQTEYAIEAPENGHNGPRYNGDYKDVVSGATSEDSLGGDSGSDERLRDTEVDVSMMRPPQPRSAAANGTALRRSTAPPSATAHYRRHNRQQRRSYRSGTSRSRSASSSDVDRPASSRISAASSTHSPPMPAVDADPPYALPPRPPSAPRTAALVGQPPRASSARMHRAGERPTARRSYRAAAPLPSYTDSEMDKVNAERPPSRRRRSHRLPHAPDNEVAVLELPGDVAYTPYNGAQVLSAAAVATDGVGTNSLFNPQEPTAAGLPRPTRLGSANSITKPGRLLARPRLSGGSMAGPSQFASSPAMVSIFRDPSAIGENNNINGSGSNYDMSSRATARPRSRRGGARRPSFTSRSDQTVPAERISSASEHALHTDSLDAASQEWAWQQQQQQHQPVAPTAMTQPPDLMATKRQPKELANELLDAREPTPPPARPAVAFDLVWESSGKAPAPVLRGERVQIPAPIPGMTEPETELEPELEPKPTSEIELEPEPGQIHPPAESKPILPEPELETAHSPRLVQSEQAAANPACGVAGSADEFDSQPNSPLPPSDTEGHEEATFTLSDNHLTRTLQRENTLSPGPGPFGEEEAETGKALLATRSTPPPSSNSALFPATPSIVGAAARFTTVHAMQEAAEHTSALEATVVQVAAKLGQATDLLADTINGVFTDMTIDPPAALHAALTSSITLENSEPAENALEAALGDALPTVRQLRHSIQRLKQIDAAAVGLPELLLRSNRIASKADTAGHRATLEAQLAQVSAAEQTAEILRRELADVKAAAAEAEVNHQHQLAEHTAAAAAAVTAAAMASEDGKGTGDQARGATEAEVLRAEAAASSAALTDTQTRLSAAHVALEDERKNKLTLEAQLATLRDEQNKKTQLAQAEFTALLAEAKASGDHKLEELQKLLDDSESARIAALARVADLLTKAGEDAAASAEALSKLESRSAALSVAEARISELEAQLSDEQHVAASIHAQKELEKRLEEELAAARKDVDTKHTVLQNELKASQAMAAKTELRANNAEAAAQRHKIETELAKQNAEAAASTVATLQAEAESLRKTLATHSKEVEDLTNKLEGARGALSSAETSLAEMRATHEAHNDGAVAKAKADAAAVIAKLQAKLADANAAQDAAEAEAMAARCEVEAKLGSMQQHTAAKLEASALRCAQLEKDLAEQIALRAMEGAVLESELDISRALMHETDAKVRNLEASLAATKADVDQARQAAQDATDAATASASAATASAVATLQAEAESLRKDLATAHDRVKRLEKTGPVLHPAAAGDMLLSVEGKSVAGVTHEDVVSLFRGRISVRLTVRRVGCVDPVHASLTRASLGSSFGLVVATVEPLGVEGEAHVLLAMGPAVVAPTTAPKSSEPDSIAFTKETRPATMASCDDVTIPDRDRDRDFLRTRIKELERTESDLLAQLEASRAATDMIEERLAEETATMISRMTATERALETQAQEFEQRKAKRAIHASEALVRANARAARTSEERDAALRREASAKAALKAAEGATEEARALISTLRDEAGSLRAQLVVSEDACNSTLAQLNAFTEGVAASLGEQPVAPGDHVAVTRLTQGVAEAISTRKSAEDAARQARARVEELEAEVSTKEGAIKRLRETLDWGAVQAKNAERTGSDAKQ